MPVVTLQEALSVVAATLDGLGVAMCAFDEDDQTLLWNRSFVTFFPEHAGHVFAGEPYRSNLRRFYEHRLDPAELGKIDAYIDAGIARHRAQQKPYSFEHRGQWLSVASLPVPGVGRIRCWRADRSLPDSGADMLRGDPGGLGLFDALAEGVMVSIDGRVSFANRAFNEMYRRHDGASTGDGTFEEMYDEAWQRAAAAERPRYEQGRTVLEENIRFVGAPFEIPLPERRWTRVVAHRQPDGKMFSLHSDVSALKQQHEDVMAAERRVRESEARLQQKSALLEATLECLEQGVMMVNAAGRVEVCNRRAIELTGVPAALMALQPRFDDVVEAMVAGGELGESSPEALRLARNSDMLGQPHRFERTRQDGRVVEVHNVPLEGGGALRTYTDVTERRQREDRMRHIARHDALTTLANRSLFLERLEQALASAAQREGGLAVHFVDLDRFKPVNDEWGHATGDLVLAAIAERLRAVAREQDLVARLGGDEFAVLQYSVREPATALKLAHRLALAVGQPLVLGDRKLQVGVSIGIAMCPAHGDDAQTLLQRADDAMYAAKRGGKAVQMSDAAPLGHGGYNPQPARL